MTRTKAIKILNSLIPCSDSTDWVKRNKGTPQQLWDKCNRADWMLWLLAAKVVKGSIHHKRLIKCCRKIVILDLKNLNPDLKWAVIADGLIKEILGYLKLVKKWTQGKATQKDIEILFAKRYTHNTQQPINSTIYMIFNPNRYTASAVVCNTLFSLNDIKIANVVRKYFPDCPIFETAD